MSESRTHLAQHLVYLGEWVGDTAFDGENQPPGHPYVQGCRETVAHLLACHLVQAEKLREGVATSDMVGVIDWGQLPTTVDGWLQEIARLVREFSPEEFRTYRVTVIERREFSYDVQARSAGEAEEIVAEDRAGEPVHDEHLGSEITNVEEI